jgi:hypothetical protein
MRIFFSIYNMNGSWQGLCFVPLGKESNVFHGDSDGAGVPRRTATEACGQWSTLSMIVHIVETEGSTLDGTMPA